MEKRTILIVEDDKFVSEVYNTKLTEIGYKTLLAENGKEGIDVIKKNRIDLILLDIIMPIMNGIEMLEEVKKNDDWKKIPVILLTNVGEKESLQKIHDLGATDYLIKSHFTPAEVIEKIESVFNKQLKENK